MASFSLNAESFIARFVIAQGVVLLLGIAGTAIFLVCRNFLAGFTRQKREIFSNQIVEYLFSPPDLRVNNWAHAKELRAWDRALFKDVLLSQIHDLSGSERDTLIQLYGEIGFFREDELQTASRVWWKRLTAVIRLDTVSIPECAPAFLKCLNDDHPIVALGATRALSRLGNMTDPKLIFLSLEHIGSHRSDGFVEIIENIGFNYGPMVVCDYLDNCENFDIALACVKVLGHLRVVEASAILNSIIENSADYPNDFLVAVIEAMVAIGNPESIASVRLLMHHPSENIREKATNYLHTMDDGRSDVSDELRTRVAS